MKYLTGNWSPEMRNNVKILDPSRPNTITALNPGDMFVYQDVTNSTNVYMKVNGHVPYGQHAVLLPTGMVYPINEAAQLSRVVLVQVGSTS